jgi:nucleoid DNA-binding protein
MSGFKEDVLIPELVRQGFSVRESRRVIDEIFESIKAALHRRETIELPFGTFGVVRRPSKRPAWRFAKVIVLNARQLQVAFVASDEVERAASRCAPTANPRKRIKKPKSNNDVEGNRPSPFAELVFDFVNQNVDSADQQIFFDELREGPFVAAVFERHRPRPDELKPLTSAGELIANSRPKEMPVDDWKRIYACLSWFVYWSQRVIPRDVYAAAILEAKRELLKGC